MTAPKPQICPLGFIQSDETGPTGQKKNACRHCGRTKEFHKKRAEEQILPSDIVASEWLEKAGYKNAPYFELARVVLTRYIEYERIGKE
jgi:hypothetical protein